MSGPARPGWDVPGRWETPRTPSRHTYGAAIAQVAADMGQPLQPWQRRIVDVATEVLPSGRWAYRTVTVGVPRQGGKTTLLGPKNVHRALIRPGAKTWLTAQTRQDGRDIFDDIVDRVTRSPLAPLFDDRKSNGSERLKCRITGAFLRVFVDDALHGKANESVDVDEVWAYDEERGNALEQTVRPTFTTTGGQWWLVSNAGTLTSVLWRRMVDAGRAAVERGDRTGHAHFEWGLDAVEAAEVARSLSHARAAETPRDESEAAFARVVALIMSRHPGQYVLDDSIDADARSPMPIGEFLRAYGNVWTLTADAAIPAGAWKSCRDPALPPYAGGDLSLSFDVALDRSAAIAAAWWPTTPADPGAVDVIDSRPGTGWLADRVEEVASKYGVREVVCDPRGPTLDVADELDRRGRVSVRRLTTAEVVSACAGLMSDVETTRMRHRGSKALDTAAGAVETRTLGDRWVWSREGPVAPITAATWARYGLLHRPAPLPAPGITLSEALDERVTRPEPTRRRSLTV